MAKKSSAIGKHLARRIDRRPLLVDSAFLPSLEGLIEKADAYYDLGQDEIEARYQKEKVMMLQAYGLKQSADYDRDYKGSSTKGKHFAFADGVAVIPIHGSLVNRCNDTACGAMTGYNMIQSELAEAVADPDVERILFDVDSGGGEVSGCAETAQMIRDAGAVKPTMAFIDSSCYSAAYWLASAANKVVSLSSGGVGSIGALIAHVDYSEQLANEGVKITYIHAGKDKVSGNPYEALSEETRENWQSEVDKTRYKFASAVADNRGLDVSVVMGTEARGFSADDALALGLIDELSDPMHALSLFDSTARGGDDKEERPKDRKKASDNTPKALSKTEPKGDKKMEEQELAAIKEEAAVAERARVAAIVNSDEAKGREGLAAHFAFKTSMAPEDAIAAMTASPKTEAKQEKAETKPDASASAREAFAESMQATQNPNIGAGDPVGGGATAASSNPDIDAAASIMKSFGMAFGA